MDWLNPLASRFSGANINRDTVGNVKRAGLSIEREDSFWMSIVKMLRAGPGEGSPGLGSRAQGGRQEMAADSGTGGWTPSRPRDETECA
jgi:hypothetical protein